jgi:hypothetical protein
VGEAVVNDAGVVTRAVVPSGCGQGPVEKAKDGVVLGHSGRFEIQILKALSLRRLRPKGRQKRGGDERLHGRMLLVRPAALQTSAANWYVMGQVQATWVSLQPQVNRLMCPLSAAHLLLVM